MPFLNFHIPIIIKIEGYICFLTHDIFRLDCKRFSKDNRNSHALKFFCCVIGRFFRKHQVIKNNWAVFTVFQFYSALHFDVFIA